MGTIRNVEEKPDLARLTTCWKVGIRHTDEAAVASESAVCLDSILDNLDFVTLSCVARVDPRKIE